MNERIEKLAEQAGFENGHQDRNGNSLSGELEKFAELIVKECAEVARAHTLEKYHGVIGGYYGIVYVEEAIKQHFGVKQHDQSGTH